MIRLTQNNIQKPFQSQSWYSEGIGTSESKEGKSARARSWAWWLSLLKGRCEQASEEAEGKSYSKRRKWKSGRAAKVKG